MSKTVKLTRAARIDEVIEGVNGYYEKSWKVQTRRFMSRRSRFTTVARGYGDLD
ncbi:hypothetical protein QJS10_CPA16g00512 [Acorus calamus]|uniref:Uncharacterized protein n=1 Tax=Acorus calamus TaxID=4465 RepID=A0AAV9D2B7_ACOCL|nr:hypothetical protein QJS10_CPA16g00512 [Acorus calamus]